MMEVKQYTAKDFKSPEKARWCAGCGDHALLLCLTRAMADLGIAPHETVVISGIGCSSRLPYYVSTYGMHTIHGRSAAIATGVKTANPELTVWQVTGDGDCLAIGGNHFIHEIRRNIDLNVLLFNNEIYGLTKGQYSPTSQLGFVSKSSPYGTVEEPFRPAELALGARSTFFARTLAVDLKTTEACMLAAAKHKGCSVVECLTNCMIFNNGVYDTISSAEFRLDRTITLEDGKPMIFGKNRDKGLILDGFQIKAVKIGENGITENDLLVHDAKMEDPTLHFKLGAMRDDLPVAMGVIRSVSAPSYETAVKEQVDEVVKAHGLKDLNQFLHTLSSWEVK